MSGRFVVNSQPREIADHFEVAEPEPDLIVGRFNVAPSQFLPAVRPAAAEDTRELVALRWGLVPRWSLEPKVSFSSVIARDDRVEASPAFRDAYHKCRCLLPATGFFEWTETRKHVKQPWHFRLKDGGLFAFAGLWERWDPDEDDEGEPLESCALITTIPNRVVAPVHPRMPAILRAEHYASWLDPETPLDRLRLLLAPYPADEMEAWPVSSFVNDPAHQGERCLKPVV